MGDCGYFEELISAELDGELSDAEKEALRAHLEHCENCRAYREALRAVAGTAADLPDPPATLTGRIMDAVRREAGRKPKTKVVPFARYLRAGALAAAAALVIWAGFRVAGPKGAAKTTSAAPSVAMSMMAADSAPAEAAEPEMEPESGIAAPETQARGAEENSLFAAAAPAAASEEALEETEAAFDAGEPTRGYALTRGDTGELLAEGELGETVLRSLLTAEKPAPVPDRTADYALTLTSPAGETETWSLWKEDGGMVVQRSDSDDAGWTVTPEIFREWLGF